MINKLKECKKIKDPEELALVVTLESNNIIERKSKSFYVIKYSLK